MARKIIRKLIWMSKDEQPEDILDVGENDTTRTRTRKLIGRLGYLKQVIDYKEEK